MEQERDQVAEEERSHELEQAAEPSQDPAFEERFAELYERLSALREAGFERQSIGEFRTAEALIARLPALPELARPVIIRRAREKLKALEESALAERSALLARFEGEAGAEYREAIESGELDGARRALRRVARGGARLLGRPRQITRIDEEPSAPTPPRAPSSRPRVMAKADRYREAALDAEAELTLLRAKRQLPEIELRGRYHAPSVAASSLGVMERVGRPYLLQQIARLEAYEAIAALIGEYQPKKKAKPRAKKPGRSSRR